MFLTSLSPDWQHLSKTSPANGVAGVVVPVCVAFGVFGTSLGAPLDSGCSLGDSDVLSDNDILVDDASVGVDVQVRIVGVSGRRGWRCGSWRWR